MKLAIYQIDVFAERAFEGNPAAVVPLEEWLPDETMQAIAAENNLAETAFFVRANGPMNIRWFTPKKEVKLCGHATLASAFVLFNYLGYESDEIVFESLSGRLSVSRTNKLMTLDFPSQIPEKCECPPDLVKGLGSIPIECHRNEDYIAVFGNERKLAAIQPDHGYLSRLDLRGVIATAPSSDKDFVARFFAPKFGNPEDPVTGSAFTQITPYWSERLGKKQLKARQISARGGNLLCQMKGDRVHISGYAVKYMKGTIEIPT